MSYSNQPNLALNAIESSALWPELELFGYEGGIHQLNLTAPAALRIYSIKAVLPVLAPHLDYSTLGDVNDCLSAQTAYLEAVSPGCSDARRAEIGRDLANYCRLDSLAMLAVEVPHGARVIANMSVSQRGAIDSGSLGRDVRDQVQRRWDHTKRARCDGPTLANGALL
jgi:hypothetical protein